MRLLCFFFLLAAAWLPASCRDRTEQARGTPVSQRAMSDTGGSGGVDSPVSRDAQETMSRSELEGELDRLEQQLVQHVDGGR
jgi:hypothetical protein